MGCNARNTTSNSIICVCNATYCDILPPLKTICKSTYYIFTSTPEGHRHAKQTGHIIKNNQSEVPYQITLNRSVTHQTILGFGGAFTDSAGINLKSLPEAAQEKLLLAYYSSDGAEYNLGRVPIGGADFSTRGYTYADKTEGSIDDFSLQYEDFNYKVKTRK